MARKKDAENIDDDSIPISGSDNERTKLLKSFVKSLNKEFGEDTVMVLDGSVDSMDMIPGWISTGIPVIDNLLGGKGFPVGRVNEIFGTPGAGKTSIAMHVIKSAINAGGLAFMLDSEAAFSFDMARKIGVDVESMGYSKPKTLEEIWRQIEHIINFAKTHAPERLVLIVVDSVAQAPSQNELDKDISSAEMGERARINSKGLRKATMEISDNKICLLLINQVRANIGEMFGPKESIPGGNALEFAATIKLRAERKKLITIEGEKDKPPIGQYIALKTAKNKIAPPFQSTLIEFFYDSGIPYYSGLMEDMKDRKILNKKGSYLVFRGLDGVEDQFYAKDFDTFMGRHPELLDFSTWNSYVVKEAIDE